MNEDQAFVLPLLPNLLGEITIIAVIKNNNLGTDNLQAPKSNSPTYYLLITKERSDFTVEKHSRHRLHQVITLSFTGNGTADFCDE